MIQVFKLNKKFGKLEVLKDLDLAIKSGGIFAVLGPNGSGKTTLIKCLLGMVVPDKGQIMWNHESVLGKYDYRKNINYLPQIANFPTNLSVQEFIEMVQNLRAKPSNPTTYIDLFQLHPFLKQKLGNLSGGTKQKVNIVLAFMFDSDLIILDEPTSGLDPVSMIRLRKIIQEQKAKGKTILVTSHIMNFVEEIADEIVFLLDGKIYFQGTIGDLKSQTKENDVEHAIANLMTQANV